MRTRVPGTGLFGSRCSASGSPHREAGAGSHLTARPSEFTGLSGGGGYPEAGESGPKIYAPGPSA